MGDTVVNDCRVIRPWHIGVLASIGRPTVAVRRRPLHRHLLYRKRARRYRQYRRQGGEEHNRLDPPDDRSDGISSGMRVQ